MGLNSPTHWPHAPRHLLGDAGTYMVTAATYQHELRFRSDEQLDFLQETLIAVANQRGWQLDAWAVFPNHYHFVGHSPREGAESLQALVKDLHTKLSMYINRKQPKRKYPTWYNYWDTLLDTEQSYFSRLHYVHTNPVKHGLVADARDYRWCSAAWLESTCAAGVVEFIYAQPTERLKIQDDFAMR